MATVLVVEDDDTNRELVTRFLMREGYRVLHAVNGRQGVDMALKERPDLILMDLSMPEMDGFEASRAIKTHPFGASIPIIAFTAHSLSQDVRKALEAGCDHYETKPVLYPRLMRKIGSLLDGK